ncbi:hypothetical protein ACF068_31020 [Streptomyces sp. NPDC016309]|uniref:hypothetical protein n=1 Tax=Streptomyces sp. NPDC016309 TaxID=3364965 RepID=UPI0036F59A1C
MHSTGDLTTPDHAARARVFWEAYRELCGEEISNLITDLMHLADVDEHFGGGAHAVRQAVADYVAEQPVWPRQMKTPRYLGQFRPAGSGWLTIATGDETAEPMDVAGCLWDRMQKAGFRTGEIQAHMQDLVAGEVLVADDGTAFRVIDNPEYWA